MRAGLRKALRATRIRYEVIDTISLGQGACKGAVRTGWDPPGGASDEIGRAGYQTWEAFPRA